MAGYVGGIGIVDVTRLRRMAAADADSYPDALLVETITRYPVPDVDGYWPDEAGWIATYDLANAAADIWSEKAAAIASNFDFDADGATFSKSQQVTHYERQARRWRSLRQPGSYTVQTVVPANGDPSDVGTGVETNVTSAELDFSLASQSGLLGAVM